MLLKNSYANRQRPQNHWFIGCIIVALRLVHICALFCCHMISISHKQCEDLQLHFIRGNFVLISWLQFTLRFHLVFFPSFYSLFVIELMRLSILIHSRGFFFAVFLFHFSLSLWLPQLFSQYSSRLISNCAFDVSTFLPPRCDTVSFFWLTHVYIHMNAHTEEQNLPTCCSETKKQIEEAKNTSNYHCDGESNLMWTAIRESERERSNTRT